MMRMRIPAGRWKRLFVMVALGLLLPAWLVGAESPEVREIKAQLDRQVERIQSLDVAYKLTAKTELKPEQLRALSGFRNQLFLPDEEWRIAFKGPKRYSRQIQPERVEWLAKPDEFGLVPPADPDPKAPKAVQENEKRLKQEYDRAIAASKAAQARGGLARRDPAIRDLMDRDVTRAFNGRSVWMRRPLTAAKDQYQVWAGNSKINWFQPAAYLAATGLHVADPTIRDPQIQKIQGMFQLSEWLKEQSYEIEERTEVVDGSTCLVLKGSMNSFFQPALLVGEVTDRIWLDRDHGLALRKRELAKSGTVVERRVNSEFKEIEPGLWLPFRSRHEQFPADSPPEWKGKPAITEEIRVERLEINRVPDDLFDMVPKKEDFIEDLRGRF